MKLKYGLISTDDHGQVNCDAFTQRMSKAKWGDAIPQLWPTQDPEHMAVDWGEPDTWRWFTNGKMINARGVSNCATVMIDENPFKEGSYGEAGQLRMYFPQRWADVPKIVYDPIERLKAMDFDRIDAAILFPNDPVQSGKCFEGSPEFELDVVRAYNDAISEFPKASDRYVALTMIPYMSGIETTLAEVERATKMGHKGINMEADPSKSLKGLKHFNDRYWDPLWALCRDLGIAVHWHAGAGVSLEVERWKGFNFQEQGAVGRSASFTTPAQYLSNHIFSGVMDRFPDLYFITAETGLGWINYVLEGCDHEWERRALWNEGLKTRPSEIFSRQMLVDYWFEEAGISQRHDIGVKNIMWEGDYPHPTATWPDSWKFVDWSMAGVPKDEKELMLWGNAVRVYDFKLD